MELLIVVMLISLVFAAAISIYISSLKFLKTRQAVDVTVMPDAGVEEVMRKVAVANSYNLTSSSQIAVRVDQACNGTPNVNSAANFGDDSWWHFGFASNKLLALCDAVNNTTLVDVANPAGTTSLADNLDSASSTFALINPTGGGTTDTVVRMHLDSTTLSVDTETALGAMPKR